MSRANERLTYRDLYIYKRNRKAFYFLKELGNDELASHCLQVDPPSNICLNLCLEDTDIRIVSAQQIDVASD